MSHKLNSSIFTAVSRYPRNPKTKTTTSIYLSVYLSIYQCSPVMVFNLFAAVNLEQQKKRYSVWVKESDTQKHQNLGGWRSVRKEKDAKGWNDETDLFQVTQCGMTELGICEEPRNCVVTFPHIRSSKTWLQFPSSRHQCVLLGEVNSPAHLKLRGQGRNKSRGRRKIWDGANAASSKTFSAENTQKRPHPLQFPVSTRCTLWPDYFKQKIKK